ncbi:hypothetical protein PF010_g17421 [Phytophthora fragariae]|uniref:Secreted protein n=1 Tax=Phytophthora fragariae TaxID=53985 RepID=A0A6G0KNP4_9STRA|nr:hypothetical protein PF010_g17421 [Phytophthora fragariae]KAE9207306.1 hypothetical protein PF004_g17068 [Phytophthora fragariae]KAE9334891.1 hypothetical protein PF008_g13746 [Phytophthora fragariae]
MVRCTTWFGILSCFKLIWWSAWACMTPLGRSLRVDLRDYRVVEVAGWGAGYRVTFLTVDAMLRTLVRPFYKSKVLYNSKSNL